jgi:hypothetical protein
MAASPVSIAGEGLLYAPAPRHQTRPQRAAPVGSGLPSSGEVLGFARIAAAAAQSEPEVLGPRPF